MFILINGLKYIMKIYLVRHGESKGNILNVTQGQLDYDLTKNGKEQAKKTAFLLKNERIDYVFSSDLKRAVKTMNEIIKFHIEIKDKKIVPELRERLKGEFQGIKKEKLNDEIKKSKKPYHLFLPKGGESLKDSFDNIKDFCYDLNERAKNNNILVVSHGEPLACIMMHLLNSPVNEYKKYLMKNAELKTLEIIGNTFRLIKE